jgi:MFS family permease
MLGSVIAALFSGEASRMVGRARRAAIAYVIAGLCAFIGLGFLLGALYTALAGRFGSIETSLGFGIAFLLIGGIVLLINAIIASRVRKIAATRRRSELTTLAATAAVSILPGLLRGKATPVSMVAAPVLAVLAYMLLREKTPHHDDEPDDKPQ